FGEETVLSEGTANRFTWVGRLGYYRQPDLNTYWLRARIYDPQRGRFVSRDLLLDYANRYQFPTNSPLMWVDPSGTGPEGLAYIVGRCPGKQGEEWGCSTPFPIGWPFSHAISEGDYRIVHRSSVWAENVKCDCTKFLGLFGKRTCSLTFVHRHVVTKVPVFRHWSKITTKDETTREKRESPETECVRVAARTCPPPSSLPRGPYPQTPAGEALKACHQALRDTWAQTQQCGEDIAESQPFRLACLVVCAMYP
ncbi:unnamed protein product, partial [marine sediment metagenome]